MAFAGLRSPWPARLIRAWPGLLVWLAGAGALLLLDGLVDLAQLALLLVLVAALAALWTGPWMAAAANALAVLAFNWAFVPPRGSFGVDLHQHALLLFTMLAVSAIVSGLLARQRRVAAREQRQARQSEALRRLAEALRAVEDPLTQAAPFCRALEQASGASAALLLLPRDVTAADAALLEGQPNADEQAGLRLCARQGQALGPGTGRHEEQPVLYLPVRGQRTSLGAALLRAGAAGSDEVRRQAQAMCDQLGLALEQAEALRSAAAARQAAADQALRNTLLAAIAHDHRTPLATILSAASALHDQADRLDAAQRQRLAASIVDEADQLARMTENTLQLARLDTPGRALQVDWESAEEIVGTVMRRLRQRDQAGVRARVQADLPLLRCDAVLLVQLLSNLVDNALRHGAPPVEVLARRIDGQLLLAVRDRGPGVPPALRERIFETFQRGTPGARGAGVGLAVCRAIARAHGGELRLRPRGHGGSAFELWLPLETTPPAPRAEDAR